MALPGLLAISPQADSLDSGRMIRLPRSAVDSMTSSNEASSLLQKRDFYGRGTYFEPGQGACGWSATSTDRIAALNSNQYGNMGQPSSHCGHKIRIKNTATGAQTVATVQDACPGCNYGDLDLSPAAFSDLAPESQGVVSIE
ncbi:hypothetical protein EMMF5_002261 [Cystobasidiomycetes sp. EMM_F5]